MARKSDYASGVRRLDQKGFVSSAASIVSSGILTGQYARTLAFGVCGVRTTREPEGIAVGRPVAVRRDATLRDVDLGVALVVRIIFAGGAAVGWRPEMRLA
jgi:hypothetical protein